MRRLTLWVLVAGAATVAGCSAGTTESQYCVEIEKVLRGSKATIDDEISEEDFGTAEQAAESFEDLQDEYDDVLDRLSSLQPPDDLELEHGDLVSGSTDWSELNPELVDALRDGDEAGAKSAMVKMQVSSKRVDRALKVILPECDIS